jgi:hypothetical protein
MRRISPYAIYLAAMTAAAAIALSALAADSKTAAQFEAEAAADYREAVGRTNQYCKERHLTQAQCSERLKALAAHKQKLDQSVTALRKAEQDQDQARRTYTQGAQTSLAKLAPRGAPPLVPKGGEDTGQLRARYLAQLDSLKNSCGKGRDPTSPACTQIEPERQRDQVAYQQFLQLQSQKQAQMDTLKKTMHDLLKQIVGNFPSR